ncbi:MAG: hypothetical protein MUF18_19130 [Fimbriiglobus sp.]|nr:hypothetical protein [Fimbriiglobus sp.]
MSNRPPDSQDRARFSQQLDSAFEDASRLAGSSLAPAEFYEKLLTRALGAINAPAGAVWLRTPQGFLQVAAQQNLEKVGLDDKRGGRQCHNEVLRQVFQAAPPRPVMVEPQGRLGNGPVEPGGVPAANLTDYYALFAPIVGPEKQSLGLLEVFQESSHDPRMYQTFLQYTLQMAGYASQYHSFTGNRQNAGTEKAFTQVEAFARLIHTTLNPTECAYHIANEGRKLIEADRVCVGVRHGAKTTVEAVSGADVVEKASTHVRRLRALFDAVLKFNDKLVFQGTRDEALPPNVLSALDAYLAESQPKLLVVSPIRDEREKDSEKPARSALLVEVFNPPDQADALLQRVDVVGKHAASALYNAAELKRIPFKPLWWPVVKLQDGLGGKTKLYTLLGVLAALALIALMVFWPAPLKMDAKGQFMPEHVVQVYSPAARGTVEEVMVTPGQLRIKPGDAVVKLFDKGLAEQLGRLDGEIDAAQKEKTLLTARLQEVPKDSTVAADFSTRLAQADARENQAKKQKDDLVRRNKLIANESGYFLAVAPDFPPSAGGLREWANISGGDVREKLRSEVNGAQPLVRLGALDGPWRGDTKIPQRGIGHVNRAFATEGDHFMGVDPKGSGKPTKYLRVTVLFAGFETESFEGKLFENEVNIEAVPNKDDHNETEPVIQAFVRVDIPADRLEHFKKAGAEMRVKIHCGDRPLGYSLFHGVWEWFYEKVIFYF